MNYQLELFERIILGDYIDTNPELSGEELKTIIEKEVAQTKRNLIEDVFKLAKQKKIQTYIQNHQRSIIFLNTSIEEKLRKVDKLGTDLLQCLRFQLERLYVFLEKQFPDFLNNELPVSNALVDMWEQDKRSELRNLFRNLNAPEIDQKLKTFVKEMVSQISSKRLTRRSFEYLTLLIGNLLNEMRKAKKLSTTLIEQTLFSYNYNDLSFFTYSTAQILEVLKNEEDVKEKAYKLRGYLKTFRNRYLKTTLSYNPLIPSIKDQIIFWLEEEIALYSDSSFESLPPQEFKREKIITSLSVSQLAYFHRVLFEVGAIPVRNQKEIARFLADNFKTMKTEKLSPESINSKYYNIEDATKSVVKDLVIKMLNTINRKN